MKTESANSPNPAEPLFITQERERFIQSCCELYWSERRLAEVVGDSQQLSGIEKSLVADKSGQASTSESGRRSAGAPLPKGAKYTEEPKAEGVGMVAPTTARILRLNSAEPVRAQNKSRFVWLTAAVILLAVTATAAIVRLPRIIAPPFTTDQSSASVPAIPPNAIVNTGSGSSAPAQAVTKKLVEDANALVINGELANARLLYQRAVDAGDAQAAVYLGKTYDPAFLKRARFGKPVRADVKVAEYWYRRARDLGASEAGSWLNAIHK